MNTATVVVGLLLLLVNGFFVAVEFSLVGSRRSKLAALADDGARAAETALDATADLTMQLAGSQLGITIASLAIGFVAEPAVVDGLAQLLAPTGINESVLHAVALLVGLGIVAFLHLLIGEMVPKSIALANPERTLLLLARPARAYLSVCRPLVRVLNGAAWFISRRFFRVEPRDELGEARTVEEFAVMLAESHEEGVIEDFAHELLTGVLDFGGRDAASVMVPRDDIVWVPASASVGEAEALVVTSGHSRLLVADAGDIDRYRGFIHSKDLLTVPAEGRDAPVPPRLVRRLLKVRVDWSLEDVLLRMRRARVHLAVVLGEDEAVAGLLTLEDLLEELVGDILDETDGDHG